MCLLARRAPRAVLAAPAYAACCFYSIKHFETCQRPHSLYEQQCRTPTPCHPTGEHTACPVCGARLALNSVKTPLPNSCTAVLVQALGDLAAVTLLHRRADCHGVAFAVAGDGHARQQLGHGAAGRVPVTAHNYALHQRAPEVRGDRRLRERPQDPEAAGAAQAGRGEEDHPCETGGAQGAPPAEHSNACCVVVQAPVACSVV